MEFERMRDIVKLLVPDQNVFPELLVSVEFIEYIPKKVIV